MHSILGMLKTCLVCCLIIGVVGVVIVLVVLPFILEKAEEYKDDFVEDYSMKQLDQ